MRVVALIIMLSAVSVSAQDTTRVSHLERSANAKGYSFLSAVFAGVFTSFAVKDKQHTPPAVVFTMTSVGLSIYSWVELKRAGMQQTAQERKQRK